jgi:cyclopropane fatty-acyl-phospholipid synthase-like methyltransferase
MARREQRNIGVETVRRWARSLPQGSVVLDLGCGHGLPLSMALFDEGCVVYGVDASPSMVAAFRDRLPHAHVICEPVEDSRFFGRRFDGALAWGLLFLMTEDSQQRLIRKVALALNPGGRLLFTSPAQACTWVDVLTGRESQSLGAETYRALLSEAGLTIVGEYTDEADNDYYEAAKQ